MTVEDRVVTTAFLRELNEYPGCDELQIGPGTLNGLEVDAFHVLVPVGHTHGPAEAKVVCQAQLAVGTDGPLLQEVLISREMYESLPTAFSVLNTVKQLLPMTVGEVDDELETLCSGEHHPLAETASDDPDVDTPEQDFLDGGSAQTFDG